ncbi:MAG: hypothetical protein H0U78_03670 [Rickettsiaceae bacterium]|nr:hypothetical protein [Rickettsiaceae bacterium]
MSKKTIDEAVSSLNTLDPSEVLDMLSKITNPLIKQMAEVQGVKPYIVNSVIREAEKWAKNKIAEKKQEGQKQEEQKDNSSDAVLEVTSTNEPEGTTTVKSLVGDLIDS